MLNHHREFSTGLRPTSLDETVAHAPAPLAGAGRGGGSRRTKLKRDRWATIVFRLGAAHLKGANLFGTTRPPTLSRPRHRASGRTPVFRRALGGGDAPRRHGASI